MHLHLSQTSAGLPALPKLMLNRNKACKRLATPQDKTMFEPIESGTRVTITFRNIPPGIKPEDSEVAKEQTWEKPAC